jgi:glycosyltransferase involved in cell wall biosynthesis
MKIFVACHDWDHMGSNSGFPLAKVLTKVSRYDSIISLNIQSRHEKYHFFKYLLTNLRSRISLTSSAKVSGQKNQSGSIWSTQKHSHFAANALKALKADTSSVLVLPAAEDQFCSEFACAHIQLKKRIFLCFHQPPAWFRLHWRNFHDFESLGGIICLSKHQASYFQSTCQTPICLIRHGVRHDFFTTPLDPDSRKYNRLIFVGQWLRDFDTLTEAMNRIWMIRPDIYLDCVVPHFARNLSSIRRLAVDQRVSWHADLSDIELRKLYQAADLLFLPVIDAVANNAIVEAMASGLPIVSTQIDGMSEYIPNEARSLCPRGDAMAHADAVINWLSNPIKMRKGGEIARKHAIENFDWNTIGNQLLDFIVTRRISLDEVSNSSIKEMFCE